MSAAYIAAVRHLAATGEGLDPLFTRLSNKNCIAIAAAIKEDATLREAVRHENCKGMVDTYLLSVVA